MKFNGCNHEHGGKQGNLGHNMATPRLMALHDNVTDARDSLSLYFKLFKVKGGNQTNLGVQILQG